MNTTDAGLDPRQVLQTALAWVFILVGIPMLVLGMGVCVGIG